jgi:hypothetical protein
MNSPDIFNRPWARIYRARIASCLQLSAEYTVPKLRNTVCWATLSLSSAILSDWAWAGISNIKSGAVWANPIFHGLEPYKQLAGPRTRSAQLKKDANGNYMNPFAVNWTDYDGKLHPEPLDLNCHCFVPQRTIVLNKDAWENVPRRAMG